MTIASSVAPQLARRIEIWPIEKLAPYARNARTHSVEQVAQIAASIVEFGFNAPILAASDAGIVAGHGRLLAARKLGLAEGEYRGILAGIEGITGKKAVDSTTMTVKN